MGFDFQGDTSQMTALGNIIKGLSEEYSAKINDIYAQVEAISAVWSGGDSESYISNINSKREALNSLGLAIADYGQFLNDSSNAISNFRSETASSASKL